LVDLIDTPITEEQFVTYGEKILAVIDKG